MSDFVNGFWSWFVIGITVVGLIFCLYVLVSMMGKPIQVAEDGTTGHKWDGNLQEYNNPLPKWWVYLFFITLIFAVAYFALYPGLGTAKGQFGWTSTNQYEQDLKNQKDALQPFYDSFKGKDFAALSKDPKALEVGHRLFLNNCSQCHGSDAKGGRSFPNLTDNDWLWGGKPEDIVHTITQGRNGVMPPMGEALGSPEMVRNVANYVLSLSGSAHDSVAAQLGKDSFAACAACHGADGKGNQMLGAPNLTDKTWLHARNVDDIMRIINGGLNNVMPTQAARLTPEQIQVVGAYVWGLSKR